MTAQNELKNLAKDMASRNDYDEAWMVGLEIQTLGPKAIQAFRYVLKHGTLPARRAAAFWLSDEAEIVPAEVFFLMAKDPDSEIRFHAAYSLCYVKDERTVATLRAMMREDGSEEVRQTAAQSLFGAAKINDCLPGILDDYSNSLSDEKSPKVREEVVTSLANFLKSPVKQQAIALLEKATHDSHETVRDQAHISLSVLRNEVWEGVIAVNTI
jgi:HEAT repeat protein